MHCDDDDAELLWKDADFSMEDNDRSSFSDADDGGDDDGKNADDDSTGQHAWKMWGGGKMDASMNCCHRFCSQNDYKW